MGGCIVLCILLGWLDIALRMGWEGSLACRRNSGSTTCHCVAAWELLSEVHF
ncbi:hypothetical protein BJX65DRAFT_276201 [Aspergillus insuetus]